MIAIAILCTLKLTPLDIGRAELDRVAGDRGGDVTLEIRTNSRPESYEITGDGKKVKIVGSDANGAMYGAFEFTERLHQKGAAAWSTHVSGSPFLRDRGLNLFLTLPWNYEKNDTDYDVAALTDPKRWWFQNENYWTTLLDLMAKSRLNWLDIHGAWDISVTNAPNLYAYFVTSPTFPKVGVPEEVKAANLKQLNHVIDLAHERGIRVSLMAYEANLRIPQNPNPGYEANENNVYKYTKEVVEQMIRRAPGLDAIGFRIGESGRGESFFECYEEAVKASGRDIPLVTRSWITTKQRVLPLARASKDFTVEIKYNGEQWGAPYPVMGGRMANWYSYSFEDYLSDSSGPRQGAKSSAKMWPGLPTSDGSHWPDQPYKIVWQVRANGTHRIFPFYNPNWVRRSLLEMRMGTASGYTVEGEDAYYPKRPEYYLADPKDKCCDWIHQRDEMYWMTWGRLGYDPKTPDEVFDKRAAELLGSTDLVDAWKKASPLIPLAYMAYALGPDHRDHAPELEWGGDSEAMIQGSGFDTLTFLPIQEEFANRATGGLDGRFSLWDVGVGMNWAGEPAAQVQRYLKSDNLFARQIAHAVQGQSVLASYYSSRFRSSQALALTTATLGEEYRDPNVETGVEAAAVALGVLSADPYYKPFTERLRMHTNTFSWNSEKEKMEAELARIKKLPEASEEPQFWAANMNGRANTHGDDAQLSWKVEGNQVVCRLAQIEPETAFLLVKPLPSSAFFHRIPMKKSGDAWVARFPRERWGHVIAAEAFTRGEGTRVPDAQRMTPYLVIPSQPGPTPQIYNSQEALTYLDPAILKPDKFGAILIGTRANNFFQRFDRSMKRKLLEPVERGMKLVILQEDFGKDKLDWLPKPLKFESGNWKTFDPAGQLGLEKVDTADMMWQRFLPSEGWSVFGNGGLARLKLGKGEIWVTTARLMQRMHIPAVAKAFVAMLGVGGKTKPTVLVDACTEGGPFTSSCHQDLMNSHDIPFVTLGEAIAQEQGMQSFTPVPGPVLDDDVLGGKGREMANRFLRNQVIALAKRPSAQTLALYEKSLPQKRKELMRSLGLDPLPPRTPLNARITGSIECDGYRIQLLAFESRPRFFVTAHVYVPTRPGANSSKFPVIMNVNGHWAHKKDEDRIQLRCAFQALQGYIAIAIDSPGWSFEGNSLIERRAEGNHNDWTLVEGGTNATGYYVWDAMRALDYMATRSDTDMTRVGITGASGGGLATLYAFAADDRYKAAVPVVYMSSMELAPDNGCLCNHVPGTCQIGDRSDVIGLQAPKPVLLMGAENDSEFPPAAMRLTHQKMQGIWKLYGHGDDVYVRIFPGGHDYSQPMRETAMGFFNRYLKGEGDGSPTPQPPLQAIDPEQRLLLALDPPPADERTMRDLSMASLASAPVSVSADEAIAVNGGKPKTTPLKFVESGKGSKRSITLESEPGLTTPGILVLPKGKVERVVIHASDAGKAASAAGEGKSGTADLYLDILGTGELSGIELRYPIYAGRSVAFTGGWQLVRAAEAMRRYSSHIELEGDGPLASQAVMWAGLLDPRFDQIRGNGGLKQWSDVFKEGIDPVAIQPRANLCGSLEHLRSLVKKGSWRN